LSLFFSFLLLCFLLWFFRAQSHLQRTLSHVLGLAEHIWKNNNKKNKNKNDSSQKTIPEQFVQMLQNHMTSEGSTTESGTTTAPEPSGMKPFWIPVAPGILHLTQGASTDDGPAKHVPSASLRLELCKSLLQDVMTDPKDWDAAVQTVRAKWNMDEDSTPSSSLTMQGVLYAFVALYSILRTRVVNLQDSDKDHDGTGRCTAMPGEQEGFICWAVLELAVTCLQVGLAQLYDHRAATTTTTTTTITTSMLKSALEDLQSVSNEIIDKTKLWVLSNLEFMRLNYYLLCFRQIPRLEQHYLGNASKRQETLDQFFVAAAN